MNSAQKRTISALSTHCHNEHCVCVSGAWIVTGGTSTGVMEFVGDAVKDFMLQSGSSDQHVVALGIATWGIVDNRESLISEEVAMCSLHLTSVTCRV